jgi:release factor glutamine methyltransferase
MITATPSLDASLILASLLGVSRERILTHPEEELATGLIRDFRATIERRVAGSPVAYLIGRKEFWGREFIVDEQVLVPRPDTELLIALVLAAGDRFSIGRTRPPLVHECCVGSGAVAVSLAADRPEWDLSASDLSERALDVARSNADRILGSDRPGGSLRLSLSDLLRSLVGPFDIIAANPPYLSSGEARALAAAWGEPLMALDGGPTGFDLLSRLVAEAVSRLSPGGLLFVEADPGQAAALRSLFEAAGFKEVETKRDLAGLERITLGTMP